MKIDLTGKRIVLLFVLLFAFCAPAYAQICNSVYMQVYGGSGDDEGRALVYTPDQHMIIAGKSSSGSAGGYDGMLMKIGDNGDLVWNRVLGGAQDDALFQVRQTADKGFIAIGQTRSAGNGKGDIWVVKTDASGTPAWSRYYRVSPAEGAVGKDIIALGDGGYALVANVNDSTALGDGLVARLDAAGHLLWMRRFDNGREDGFYTLIEQGGALFVGGYGTIDLKDALVLKLDAASGTLEWTKRFSGHAGYNEECVSMEHIGPADITVVMKGYDQRFDEDGFEMETARMKASGQVYASTRTGLSPMGSNTRIMQLVAKPTMDSGYIYVYNENGPLEQMPALGKLQQEGRKEWTRDYFFFSGAGNFFDVTETGGKGYASTGFIRRAEGNKIFIVKTDPAGMSGSCSPNVFGGNDGNTDALKDEAMSWKSPSRATPVTGIFTMQVNGTPFTRSVLCKKDYCNPSPPASHSDDCTTAFFTGLNEQYYVDPLDLTRTPDGDVVTVGQRYYYQTNRGQVVKLRPDGTVRWARQVTPPPGFMDNGTVRLSKVINTKDGNLLLAGSDEEEIGNGEAIYGLIVKMDLSGNVLWARRIAQVSDTRIADVKLTEDGGFLIVANGDYGHGSGHPLLARTDAEGKIIWQTELNSGNLFFRTLAYSPEGVYVGLDWNDAHERIEICKLDPQTGNLVWVKDLFKPDETSLTSLGIEKIRDTLFVAVGLQKETTLFNYIFNTAVLKMKESNGKQLGAFRISAPNMATPTDINYIVSDQAASIFIQTGDHAFAIAKECIVSGDTSIYIIKFSGDGHILWTRHYPNLQERTVRSVRADGLGILIAGIVNGKNDINEETRSGFVMRVNEKGEIEGSTAGYCASVAGSAATRPVTLQEGRPEITGNGTYAYGPLTSDPKSITFVPSPTLAYPSCSTPSLCNTVSVRGEDHFCGLGQTAVYTAVRNAGCGSPVTWQVDTAAVTIVDSTATTLRLQFKKYGETSITALLDAGCKVVKGSLAVGVRKAADELDLGPDTLLCAGTVLQLDASGDFKDFLWQDGRSSQTYEVRSAGTYQVKVTDHCGNTAVDEVRVSAAPLYPFSLGADIEKCREASVTLPIPQGFTHYTWNTDYAKVEKNDAVTLSPDQDTTYILTAEKEAGCTYKDTLRVTMLTPAPIDLGPDRSICENDSLALAVGEAFRNIQWSTGETGAQVFVRAPGRYSVSAADALHCMSADTMELLPPLPVPRVSLPRDAFICAGTVKTLDAGNAGAAYMWSTGATASRISVNEPGRWWVKVTGSDGCITTDTAFIKAIASGPHDFLPGDTAVCQWGALELYPDETYNAYAWSTGASTPQLSIKMPGTYWLKVTDNNGCAGIDTVQVAQKDCLKGLYMPTAFSPNGDGMNDLLRPLLQGDVVKYRFSVYDRWGSVVFESSELGQGWDGTIKGREAPVDGYVWVCVYQLQDEPEQVGKGAVLLIR